MTKDEAIEKLREALAALLTYSSPGGFTVNEAKKVLADTATIEAPTSEAVALELLMRDPVSTASLLCSEWDESPQDTDDWGNRAATHMHRMSLELIKLWAAAPVLDAVGVEKPQQGNAIRPSAEPAGQHEFSAKEIRTWQQSALRQVLSREGMRRYINCDPLELNPSDLRDLMDVAVGAAFAARDVAAQSAAAPAPTDAGIPISDEREAFEAWWPKGKEYGHDAAWQGWQARGQQQAGVAEDAARLDLVEAVIGEQGYMCLHDNKPMTPVGLSVHGFGLRASLDALAARRATCRDGGGVNE